MTFKNLVSDKLFFFLLQDIFQLNEYMLHLRLLFLKRLTLNPKGGGGEKRRTKKKP